MAEPTRYTFTFKELAAMMTQHLGITEGIWGIQVQMGISAANIGASKDELRPAAIVPLLEIGLQRFEEVTSLSIDAGEPGRGVSSRRRSPSTRKRRTSNDKA